MTDVKVDTRVWMIKTDANGNVLPAAQRRLETVELDLSSHESRKHFGYNYLVLA